MVFVRQFLWNLWNTAHIKRHEVTPDEVVQICQTKHVTRISYSERLLVIGETSQGRVLTVILEKLPKGVYFPITARPASRKERQEYLQVIKGGEHE